MITLLSGILIKNKEGASGRKAYGTLCSVVGICLNIFLFAGKYFAGVVSGSVAVTADAFNNLSDAGSSFITLVGFLFAGKKPDTDHPFGHGRFEYISGFVVSMAILLMGFELLQSSVVKIIHPEPVDTGRTAMIILVVSVLVKLYMAFYNRRIGRQIDSAAMRATAVDSLSDAAATTMVFLAMLLMKYTGINVDGFCGVLVALFIVYAGFNAAKDTLDPLLGKAPDKEFVKAIEDIVMGHELVEGIHDMVVHDYGPGRRMISLHAEVPGNQNIFVIHDMIDHIEREIHEKLLCDVVIHMDPVETDNEEIARMRDMVADKVKEIDSRMTIHDFRMVAGPTHTNLIFDAVAPYELKLDAGELREKIAELVKEIDESYCAVVEIDRSYV
ncbi:MAG: cation diffusion facilitator family transporter [Bacteroidales bacterium]|nr:cation diffusion facilitator family transporter [Clostridium sp.]MCM1204038.1 cation diffusion facilitator family transporter [Bacteroidales bacterium]